MIRRAALVLALAGAACAQTLPCSGTLAIDATGVVTGICKPPVTPTPIPPTTSSCSTTFCNPSTVLVVVQDNLGPEPGTGTKNAGQFVADYYMQKRGIPAGNIVHIGTFIQDGQGASCIPGGVPPHDPGTILACDTSHSDSTNINFALYQSQIAAPVQAKLAANPGKFKYIVLTYGVPITTWMVAGSVWAGVDSLLSATLIPNPLNQTGQINPYAGSTSHIDTWTPPPCPPFNPGCTPSQIILVTRLDGRTAALSAAMVDKALTGEVGVQGKGNFDYGPTAPLGSSSLAAYNLCVANPTLKPNCILNNQSVTGHMIQSAPGTAWAWGGYDVAAMNAAVYSFVPGAVGAQMNSLSGNCLRCAWAVPPNYVNLWLANGVTATWGAVGEPFTSGYALGDTLLGRLWNGYTFGEAAYISNPLVNWMMVFVGDPLYRPLLK